MAQSNSSGGVPPATPRFQAVKLIGKGGMGFVQLANDNHTGQQVAIKYLDRGFTTTLFKYTLREILHHQQLSLCQHPHIVAFQEIFLTPKYLAIVMEYVDGQNLQAYLERHGGKLPEDIARFVFQQLMIAVDFIHRKGKVNRDIKLANVLVVESGKLPLVKLCDFGFSKDKFDDSAPQTQIGTALFAAPEIFLNVKGGAYDAEAVDMWSCGVVLFMLLFGGHPFMAAGDMHLNKAEQMSKLVENTVKGNLQLPPQAEGQVVGDLLRRILVTDPERRYKMSQVQQHPWFQEKLPPGALDLNNAYVPILNYEYARQSPELIKQLVLAAGQTLGPDGRPQGPLPTASTTTTNSVMMADARGSDASGLLRMGDPQQAQQQQQQQQQYKEYLENTQQVGLPVLQTFEGSSPRPANGDPTMSFTSMLNEPSNNIYQDQRPAVETSIPLAPQRAGQAASSSGQYNSQPNGIQYDAPSQQQQYEKQWFGHQATLQAQRENSGMIDPAIWDCGDGALPNAESMDAELDALLRNAPGFPFQGHVDHGILTAVAPDPDPQTLEGLGMDVSSQGLFNSSFLNLMEEEMFTPT